MERGGGTRESKANSPVHIVHLISRRYTLLSIWAHFYAKFVLIVEQSPNLHNWGQNIVSSVDLRTTDVSFFSCLYAFNEYGSFHGYWLLIRINVEQTLKEPYQILLLVEHI